MRRQLIDIFLPKTLYRPKLPISHFQNFLPSLCLSIVTKANMPLSMSASAACHKVGQKALKCGIPLYSSFVEPFCPSMRLECTKCERASTTINLKGIEDSIFLARVSGSKWIGRMYQK